MLVHLYVHTTFNSNRKNHFFVPSFRVNWSPLRRWGSKMARQPNSQREIKLILSGPGRFVCDGTHKTRVSQRMYLTRYILYINICIKPLNMRVFVMMIYYNVFKSSIRMPIMLIFDKYLFSLHLCLSARNFCGNWFSSMAVMLSVAAFGLR